MYALFWFGILAIYTTFLLLSGLLAYLGWKRQSTWLTLFGGVPAAGLIGFGMFVCFTIAVGIMDSQNPAKVFEETFAERPSAAVSDLQGYSSFYFDSGGVYLRFRTTETEFRRLVPDGLTHRPSNQIEMATESANRGAPTWWNVRLDPKWIYYLRAEDSESKHLKKRGFGCEDEYYAFDPQTGTAYYQFEGID